MSLPPWLVGFLKWARAIGRAVQTQANYRNFGGLYAEFLEERGIENPGEATRADVADFQAHLLTAPCNRGRPYAASSRGHILACLKTIYQYLIEKGRVLIDPTAGLKIALVRRHLPRAILTHQEMRRLLNAPDTTTPQGLRDRAMLEVFYGTGLRYAELANLMCHDLDLAEQTLWVRRGKGGKDRVLPLGRWATHWLARYLEASDKDRRARGTERVFLGLIAERPSNIVLNDMVKAYAKKAGITKPVTLHALRHTFATQLLRGGADVRIIQQFLGHAEISATEIYTHLDLGDLRRVQLACHPREKRPGAPARPARRWRPSGGSSRVKPKRRS